MELLHVAWRTVGSIVTHIKADIDATVDRLDGLRRIDRTSGLTFSARSPHDSGVAQARPTLSVPSSKAISWSWCTSTAAPCVSTAATLRHPGCFAQRKCSGNRLTDGSESTATPTLLCTIATSTRLGRSWTDRHKFPTTDRQG